MDGLDVIGAGFLLRRSSFGHRLFSQFGGAYQGARPS
jgi:hypothetical protein